MASFVTEVENIFEAMFFTRNRQAAKQKLNNVSPRYGFVRDRPPRTRHWHGVQAVQLAKLNRQHSVVFIRYAD